MTDYQREKMEHRLGCFLTKSQARKYDKVREPMKVIYIEYHADGEVILGTAEGKEYFMSTRGKMQFYNDNDEIVTV